MGVSCLSDRCTRPTLQRGSPQEKEESEKMDDKEEEVMVAEEHIKEKLRGGDEVEEVEDHSNTKADKGKQ